MPWGHPLICFQAILKLFTLRLHPHKTHATLLDEDRIVMTGERPGSPQTPVMREMHRLHGEGKVAGHTPKTS